MDGIELINGDCLEVMPTLEAGSVDAIITDLPYGTTACSWDEIIPFEPMWECIKHVLKPNGVFVTTASQPFTSKLVMSNLEWFKYEWVWDKVLSSGFLNANRMPMRSHENIVIFYSEQCTYNPQKTRGDKNHSKGTAGNNRTNTYGDYEFVDNSEVLGDMKHPKSIIETAKPHPSTTEHPTQKPVALYEYLIRTYTNKDETVLDMTMGSGTTGVACVQTGRNFIGIEIDKDYFEIAKKRIETAQPALF